MPHPTLVWSNPAPRSFEPLVDTLAQINRQAYGSHAIVDEHFDDFDEEDLLSPHGSFNRLYEASNAL